jgi:acid phosphatase (class A)
MIRILLATSAIALSACAVGVRSTPSAAASAAAPHPTTLAGYLAKGALSGQTILAPPPAPGSAHDAADHALYDETRALEGSARWQQAIQDNDLWRGGALKRYACALGMDLSEPVSPATAKLLHRIELDGRTVGTPPKDFWARQRPALGNNKPVCVPREDWMRTNASYPSGHALTAWAWALVLAEIAPNRADALLQVGRESGESRMICGVHFLSDVEAGRTLGAAMTARLHAEPAFLADLNAAKVELAAARSKPAGCEG